jgi:hypothetical protein
MRITDRIATIELDRGGRPKKICLDVNARCFERAIAALRGRDVSAYARTDIDEDFAAFGFQYEILPHGGPTER